MGVGQSAYDIYQNGASVQNVGHTLLGFNGLYRDLTPSLNTSTLGVTNNANVNPNVLGQNAEAGSNTAAFARYKASLAQQEIENATRIGSALKTDSMHIAPTFVVDQIGEQGSVFTVRGGD